MEENNQKITELCFVCSEFMGQLRNGLGELTQFSQKPLYQVFGKFSPQTSYSLLTNLISFT